MDLFETLTDEHRLITRTVDALEAFIERVEKGDELDAFELNRFVVFLREFVDLVHHEREENILFPAMARLGYAKSGAPIAHVWDEHRREHKILFEIRQAAVRARALSSARRAHLVGLIRELIVFQREHIKKENELFYPTVKKEFSGKTLDDVTRLLWSHDDAQARFVEDSWLRSLAEAAHPRSSSPELSRRRVLESASMGSLRTLMGRGFVGAALWVLACGGSVNSGRTGEVAAGGTSASGGDSSNAAGGKMSGAAGANMGPTGGHPTFATGGIGQGGVAGATLGGGGTIAAGGTVASGGTIASGGMTGTGGDIQGTGGETCGRGGCIPDSNAPPVTPPGPVLCGGTVCDAPRACCLSTSECYDPNANPEACARPAPDDDLWGRPTCASNAQCGTRQFCMIDSGLCQGTGHCNPIGNCGSCSAPGATCRVCGCDGNTYPDMQTACLASATMVSVMGAGCGETTDMDGGRGAGGATDGGAPGTVTLCGSSNDCTAGELCCAITGFCFPTSDPDRCRLPPPGTRLPCTSNAQCSSSEYCFGDGCSGPGGCVSIGSQGDCGVTLEPVCGCDAVTYTSAACASARGVRVASKGQCAAAD